MMVLPVSMFHLILSYAVLHKYKRGHQHVECICKSVADADTFLCMLQVDWCCLGTSKPQGIWLATSKRHMSLLWLLPLPLNTTCLLFVASLLFGFTLSIAVIWWHTYIEQRMYDSVFISFHFTRILGRLSRPN